MLKYIAAGALAAAAMPASAATFVVEAQGNSINSGSGIANGKATGLVLSVGEVVTVTASETDLWSAGALPRWSNANGLIGNLFATGSDESGQSAGTLIGQDFGFLDILGFSAPYGSLVGYYAGSNTFQLFGTNFSGAATGNGALSLFYWDTVTGDNSGSISVDVSAVPEPGTWAMMILGFALVGGALRRRGKTTTRIRCA